MKMQETQIAVPPEEKRGDFTCLERGGGMAP